MEMRKTGRRGKRLYAVKLAENSGKLYYILKTHLVREKLYNIQSDAKIKFKKLIFYVKF